MHERSMTKDGLISLCAAQEREELVEYDGHVLKLDNGEGPFFGDLTKQELSAPLVKATRKKELEYFESKGVWRKVSTLRFQAAYLSQFGESMSAKGTINTLI